MRKVNLTIDLEREDDGRWIAEALELPGVMCYGQTREEAICNTERLAIDVLADRIAHGELPPSALSISFTISEEQLVRHESEAGPGCTSADGLASFEQITRTAKSQFAPRCN